MRNIIILLVIIFVPFFVNAQQKDIPVGELPKEVKVVLDKYVKILTTSKNLEHCASSFMEIAGGGLVNTAGTQLRSSVKPYSLKKDFENINFYKVPVKIARVAKTKTNMCGYGESAIAGDWYKIYIEKKDGSQPAPIQIVVPKGHKTIKEPKVMSIGSL